MKRIQALHDRVVGMGGDFSIEEENCYILKFICLTEEAKKGAGIYAVYLTSDGRIEEDSLNAFTIVDPSFFFTKPFPKAMKTSHATPA